MKVKSKWQTSPSECSLTRSSSEWITPGRTSTPTKPSVVHLLRAVKGWTSAELTRRVMPSRPSQQRLRAGDERLAGPSKPGVRARQARIWSPACSRCDIKTWVVRSSGAWVLWLPACARPSVLGRGWWVGPSAATHPEHRGAGGASIGGVGRLQQMANETIGEAMMDPPSGPPRATRRSRTRTGLWGPSPPGSHCIGCDGACRADKGWESQYQRAVATSMGTSAVTEAGGICTGSGRPGCHDNLRDSPSRIWTAGPGLGSAGAVAGGRMGAAGGAAMVCTPCYRQWTKQGCREQRSAARQRCRPGR